MPALTSNVVVKALGGTITVSVDVFSAAASKPTNVQVCTGAGESATPHDPTRVTTQMRCAVCGDIHVTITSKARQVGNDYVVLTAEDLETVKGDVAHLKKSMDLLPHPAGQIDVVTAPGKSVNYLAPRPGFEAAYATLAAIIASNTDVVFMTRWVPRTVMSVYSLHVLPAPDGRQVIVMRERVAGDQLKPVPDFTLPAFDEAYATMAGQYLALRKTDFSLDDYRDTTQDKLAALIASRSGVPLAGAPTTMPAVTAASLAGLQAMLDAVAPAKPAHKRAPRKAAAVKVGA